MFTLGNRLLLHLSLVDDSFTHDSIECRGWQPFSRRVSDHSLPTIVEYLVVWMYIVNTGLHLNKLHLHCILEGHRQF